jgi:hypothetical protein
VKGKEQGGGEKGGGGRRCDEAGYAARQWPSLPSLNREGGSARWVNNVALESPQGDDHYRKKLNFQGPTEDKGKPTKKGFFVGIP